VERWNEWQISNIYILDPNKFTLQYYLRTTLADLNQTLGELAESMLIQGVEMNVAHDGALRSASILLAALPIVCVYPFVQKYLIKGLTAGAVKG
jgi:putative aldouronate transport system permease protein